MASVTGYSKLQLGLHWLIALLVLTEYMASPEHIPVSRVLDSGIGNNHVWTGAAIMVLMVLRLLVRLVQGAPNPPEDEPEILRKIAVWTHWALYVLLVAIPAGGLLAAFGGVQSGMLVHDLGESAFFLLLILHGGAALLHHFYFRTDVMKRMMKPTR